MGYSVITILKVAYVKLATIGQRKDQGDITAEQARDLADTVFCDTAAEISRRTHENFVTDN